MSTILSMPLCNINPLWTIWRYTSGSKLAQVIACCLRATSNYLNQCWPLISEIIHGMQFYIDCSSYYHVYWVWKSNFSNYCHISQVPMSKSDWVALSTRLAEGSLVRGSKDRSGPYQFKLCHNSIYLKWISYGQCLITQCQSTWESALAREWQQPPSDLQDIRVT